MDELNFDEITGTLARIICKLEDFGGEELEMIEVLVDRLAMGQDMFGEWTPSDDDRDNAEEAYEEIIDALHYVSAELVRLRHER